MSVLQIESLTVLDRGPYNITLNPGQCVCLTGPSGSGKSLFLRSVADLDAHGGYLYLDQVESREFKPSDWRKQVGMLPAESRWWGDQVQDHFNAFDTEYLNQLGFDRDVMNWAVRRLSTGERQRLAILRLLGNKPKVLLLDEPTASLDSENIESVETLIKSYVSVEQVPVLWVSHDMGQVARIADRHLVMNPSQLIEERQI